MGSGGSGEQRGGRRSSRGVGSGGLGGAAWRPTERHGSRRSRRGVGEWRPVEGPPVPRKMRDGPAPRKKRRGRRRRGRREGSVGAESTMGKKGTPSRQTWGRGRRAAGHGEEGARVTRSPASSPIPPNTEGHGSVLSARGRSVANTASALTVNSNSKVYAIQTAAFDAIQCQFQFWSLNANIQTQT